MNVEEKNEKKDGLVICYGVICLHSCSVEKPDCDPTRLLDGVVEELAEETDSDEEVVKEGIPGPEEADMLNNQKLEGDCTLVKHTYAGDH